MVKDKKKKNQYKKKQKKKWLESSSINLSNLQPVL